MATMLSPHFALEEFLASQTAARLGIDSDPDTTAFANLRGLAVVMESVRMILRNKQILISSGYRSPILNRAVGGAPHSAHKLGGAVAPWSACSSRHFPQIG